MAFGIERMTEPPERRRVAIQLMENLKIFYWNKTYPDLAGSASARRAKIRDLGFGKALAARRGSAFAHLVRTKSMRSRPALCSSFQLVLE
jgi:hypothetical protein